MQSGLQMHRHHDIITQEAGRDLILFFLQLLFELYISKLAFEQGLEEAKKQTSSQVKDLAM